ncbi:MULTISPECIES: S41 family peptidase [Spirosoma]|uniref:S41 family peptidase n=1 Tax=Spirosoma liriopis TaxID=2937440 RepID=A0ABT0HS91_9BACT|nr:MULTISPECIES: S41 family peptidase [Spirosoma]MCK8495041.1 S41 family peptidase [Spirosoma liriopis]UHG94188.1 S41 family peptidase [Spirosoma oryzicola]
MTVTTRHIATSILLVCLLNQFVTAQSPASCRCSDVLDQAIRKTTNVYAGFADKVNAKSQLRYNTLIDSLQKQAIKAPDGFVCFDLLKRYAGFFRDLHVSAGYSPQLSPTTIRTIAYSESQARAYLAKRSALKPFEGIWELSSGKMKIATVADPDYPGRHISVVLSSTLPNWKPGMVQAQFIGKTGEYEQAHYVFGDFKSRPMGIQPNGNHYQIWGDSWQRIVPKAEETAQRPLESVVVKQLNPEAVYVRLPHFTSSQMAILDSLLKTHRAMIGRTPSLIFDMRGNGGGDSGAWASEEFMQLFYTQPIPIARALNRASDEWIDKQAAYVERLRKQKKADDSELKMNIEFLDSLKAHRGEFVPDKTEYVIRYDSVRTFPKRIAVLMDKGCGSASEFFLSMAKYSQKITRFGTYTGGFMDYGNANPFSLTCDDYYMYLPVTRMPWVDTDPIDNIGYKPDVPIPSTEKDWINFVLNHWTN